MKDIKKAKLYGIIKEKNLLYLKLDKKFANRMEFLKAAGIDEFLLEPYYDTCLPRAAYIASDFSFTLEWNDIRLIGIFGKNRFHLCVIGSSKLIESVSKIIPKYFDMESIKKNMDKEKR